MSRKVNSVVVLTGSGISHESGIATFRAADGLWENHRVEDVATPEAFERDPERVLRFYNQRRQQLLSGKIHPNPAHMALADFEKNFDGSFHLITQNVDDLHERAGSCAILHMHGSLIEARSTLTGEVTEWREDMTLESNVRPNIVWFGEVPFYLEKIEEILRNCDLFVAIGTSGQIYPAAGFVQCTPMSCERVEINLERTPVSEFFDESILGTASEKVPEFFKSLLSQDK